MVEENFTQDQTRLLFTILISFPLALFLTIIKNPSIRKTFNIIVGVSLQIYMYEENYLHVVFSAIIVYVISLTVKRSICGYYILTYSFLHLSSLHLYRYIFDYASWRMDITTIFMILALKYTSFGFSYQDGDILNFINKNNQGNRDKSNAIEYSMNALDEEELNEFNKFRKPFAIEGFKLEDYIGYIVFFPTALMGPFVEFNTYCEFINLSSQDYQKLPSTLIPSFKRLFLGSFFSILYIWLKDFIKVDFFLSQNGIYKLLAYSILMNQKFKYYIAFLFSESICIASGISYHRKVKDQSNQTLLQNDKASANSASIEKSKQNIYGIDKQNEVNNEKINSKQEVELEDAFDKIINVRVFPCETRYSAKIFFQNWNISVHNFLKRYVYHRLKGSSKNQQKSNQALRQSLTFVISAVWHGFYPSYYVIFIHFAIGMVIEDQFEKFRKYLGETHILSFIIGWVFTLGFFLVANYCAGILEALDWSKMIKFMGEIYYFPTILMTVVFLINMVILRKLKTQRKKE